MRRQWTYNEAILVVALLWAPACQDSSSPKHLPPPKASSPSRAQAPKAIPLPAPGPKPDILLITLDTTRADHLSTYGYERPTSPFLTSLASQGLKLANLRAPVPLTTPSHATLMTGLDPRSHGVFANYGGFDRLGEAHRTLAEALGEVGYRRGASIAAFTAGREVGLAQGFEAFFEPNYDDGPERDAPSVNADALKWLKGTPGDPVFFWAHYFDAHGPYAPPAAAIEALGPARAGLSLPPGQRSNEAEAFLYDAEVRWVDDHARALTEAMRARGRPLIICVVGDHGETLGERPLAFQHGRYLYEEQLAIPGILVGPGLGGPREVLPLTGLPDVTRTLANLAGATGFDGTSGRDLRNLSGPHPAPKGGGDALSEEDLEHVAFAFSMPCDPSRGMACAPTGAGGRMSSIRAGRWKLILTPNSPRARVELYRLDVDPDEKEDVALAHPKVTKALLRRLRAYNNEGVTP